MRRSRVFHPFLHLNLYFRVIQLKKLFDKHARSVRGRTFHHPPMILKMRNQPKLCFDQMNIHYGKFDGMALAAAKVFGCLRIVLPIVVTHSIGKEIAF